MNLKSRLFKKPWQHKDPEVRAKAVRESDDPELKAALAALAQHDDSPAVRLNALKRINTEPFWLDACLRESHADIQSAANAFLAREVPRNSAPEMLEERLQWLARVDAPDLIRHIAAEASDTALRRAALQRIQAQGFLGDCFGRESDDELAGEILQRIDQESTLERLIERLRKTSKKRAQAANARLNELRVASGQVDPDQIEADELVKRMEALGRGHGEGDRVALLEELSANWSRLSSPPEALRRRFEGAERIVRASLDRPAPEISVELASEEAAPEQSAVHPALTDAADHIRQTIRRGRKDIKPSELLGSWDRAWNQVGQAGEADIALKEEMLPYLRELQAQAEQRRAPAAHAEPAADPVADLDGELDVIAQTLEEGNISRSHELLQEFHGKLKALPPRQRPGKITGRLQRMDGRLKEMRNYQHWSNNKHRDELIEQIEKLPESGQHPDAISAALKQARDEWQRLEKLEHLPGDRKRFSAPPGQWRRFQAACKTAFDSAKPYFEKRHELHQDNLEQLEKFIDIGLALAAEENPDSAQLQKTMRAARQAIRRMDDLPPKSRGRSAARLRELMDALSKRIDDAFEQIELTKRRLINEARALVHEKDRQVAIDKAKSLQGQWQKAGSGRRKSEQKLWEEFREPIDPLFEQLKGEREQQRQVEKEALAELKQICEQAEALARVDDGELHNAQGRMAGLTADWSSRPGRPGNLNARFEKAEAALQRRIDEFQQQERRRERSRIDAVAAAIQAIWERRQEQGSADLGALLPDDTEAGDDQLLGQLLATAQRLADPEVADEEISDLAATGGEKGRQVVIEMEFLAGLESPEADRSLRMDYQVQRLAQRMSERGSQPDLETELASLQARWYQSLPQPPEIHASLSKRFEAGRGLIEKMTGR